MSKAEIKRKFHGLKVVRHYKGLTTIDDTPEIMESLEHQAKALGGTVKDAGSEWRLYKDGKFTGKSCLKPKREQDAKGTVTFNSRDLFFTHEDGTYTYLGLAGTPMEEIENGFRAELGGGFIEYTLGES